MKRKVLTVMTVISMIFVSPTSMTAQTNEPLDLLVGFHDPTSNHGTPHKTPVQIPSVELDNHTLHFNTPCDGYELRLVDSCGDVVYSRVIPSGTAYLLLPESLQGEYELQLVSGNKMFYGTIEL